MRVAIIGNSGSGKSTLERRRAAETEVPILDLDTVAWAPGKIAVPRDPADAAADVANFCDANEDWIVEGCYASLIEATLPRGPELLVLDPGVDQCTENCRSDDMSLSAHKRVYEGYGGEKQWLSSLTDQVPLADEAT